MENYIQSMCAEATKRGWRSACIIARGNAGLKLKTWRPYNAGFTLDFQEVTEELKRRYPKAKIVACGYSLGANVITKYIFYSFFLIVEYFSLANKRFSTAQL